jgi:multiple sugar transport system substrate-binding protein
MCFPSKNGRGIKRCAVLILFIGAIMTISGVGTLAIAASAYKYPAKEKAYRKKTLNVALVGEPRSEAVKKLTAEFEARTGAKVNIDVLPYTNLEEKQNVALTQKAGIYDVVDVNCIWAAQYLEGGWIVPLDGYIEKTDPNVIRKDDFVPAMLDIQGTWDGKIYGLPFISAMFHMWYRTDIFEKHNLKPPDSWDDVVKLSKVINQKEKTNGVAGVTFMAKRGIQLDVEFHNVLCSMGGYYYDKNFKATLNTPEAIRAMEYLKSLVPLSNPGVLSQDYPEAQTAFAQGKAAMLLQWNNAYAPFLDETSSKIVGKWAGYLLPGQKQSDGSIRRGPMLAGWGIGIAADSKEKDLAWEWIMWATLLEQEKKLATSGPGARKSFFEDPEIKAKYPWFDWTFKSLEYATALPRYSFWPKMNEHLDVYLSQAITGERPVKDAMNDLNKEVDRVLKESGYQK